MKENKIVILGAGESGVGAALLAVQKGFDVLVSDRAAIRPKYKDELDVAGIEWEEGHTESRILEAGEIIKSPGIPDTAALLVACREAGISIISEIEFASRYSHAKIIAVTGSNGKTTTAKLIHHILKNAGMNVALAGNVGISFARSLAASPVDYYVLEISSFQLDGILKFRPDIAIILNITPDHLDRYDYQLDNYASSKFRIQMNQDKEDVFIYWKEDPVIQNFVKDVKAVQLPFSDKKLEKGAYVANDKLHVKLEDSSFDMNIGELALQGKHNQYNSMAAAIAAKVLKVSDQDIRESLSDFKSVEHRLESVLYIKGVEYINDSKATNVNAAWYALESMKQPVVWICGGTDKGNDYSQLEAVVREKVRVVICLADDPFKIRNTFGDVGEHYIEVKDMESAVKAAYKYANKGDVVLLSPACASFDLFDNFEERGRQFKEQVKAL
jgi:UDP-N-acetylmuramoylalanine--D-glutamate ligase